MFHEFVDNNSFPKDRSAEYPHIVDIQTWVGSVQTTASENIPESHTLKVWDAIATLLNAVDPTFCTDFFDLTQDEYRVTAFEKFSKEGVLIWRRGNKVFAGTFDSERFQNLIYEWEVIVRCTIATDGAWTIDSASDGASSMNTLDHIWDGTYEDGFSDNNEAGKADRGFAIAEEIMSQLPYDPKLWHWEATPN